jgi:polyisoprenoid-binding protein YceI
MKDQTLTETTLDATDVQTYQVDPSHSQVQFSVRHLGFSKVRGRFGAFDAVLGMAPGDLSTIEAEATVQIDSVDTRDEKRDAHLRSGDFFDAENHPELIFKSTGVRNVSGDQFDLAGDLTIRGTTHPVVLKATYLGEATDPWGGERVAFDAKTKINRKDYGLNWNTVLETGGVLVGEEVEISLEIQGVQQA